MRGARKWISGLMMAALLLLGFAVWMRGSAPAPQTQPQPAPIAAAALPDVPQWPASPAMTAGQTRKNIAQPGMTEMCGVGQVMIDQGDWTAVSKYTDALTKKSRVRWLSALRSSDDYRARAAGLYLEDMLERDAPLKDPESTRDELVELAVGTKDPAVFALAYTKCLKAVETPAALGACPQLSLYQWTRLDSDNAVPWLQLAAQARRENDGAAETAAFAQAARAHTYESYDWSLLAFAQSALPGDATPTERWYIAADVIGAEAAMPTPYVPLFQYCSRDAMTDTAVREQCNAVAKLMVYKTTTLTEFSLGKALGTRVGWAPEVIENLTQQWRASMEVISQMMATDADQQWSCDSVARGNAYVSQWVRLGERGLAQQEIERSLDTVAELARKYTERMEKFAAGAQASAEAQPAAAAAAALP